MRSTAIKRTLPYIIAFILAFAFFYVLQSPVSLGDPDTYYHAKMARMMAEQGLTFDNFPYMNVTILKDNYVDYHWLYHVALIPFEKVFGGLTGIRIATVCFSSLFITLFFFILRRSNISFAPAYMLLMATVPTFVLRMSVAKATSLSLCFLFLGILFMIEKRHILLFVISLIYVWLYGGFVLLTGIAFLFIMSMGIMNVLDNKSDIMKARVIYLPALKFFLKGIFTKDALKIGGATIGGNLAGLVINPYFSANIEFYWVQIYKIAMVGSPGAFDLGRGWYATPWQVMLLETLGMLIVLAVLLYLLLKFKVKVNSTFVFAAVVAVAFLVLTKRSLRMFEYAAPVWAWFIATGFHGLQQAVSREQLVTKLRQRFWHTRRSQTVTGIIVAVAIGALGFSLYDGLTFVKKSLNNHPLHHLSGPAKWLEDNTPVGSTVFNAGWDDWPFLFYFNSSNYYLVGLDPMFMHEYNQKKYKVWFDIITGRDGEKLHHTMTSQFNSRYVVVSKKRKFLPLIRNLNVSEKIHKVFEDRQGYVFALE
jgi:hypothetical protein